MSLARAFSHILNGVSIICVIMIAVPAGRFYWTTQSENGHSERPKTQTGPSPGTQLNLADVNWKENRAALIFAMSVGCVWCQTSAPFYQRLLKENLGEFHPVAVLPQSAQEARVYVEDSLGLAIKDIRQVGLSQIGVLGTPTLIWVDMNGRVLSSWTGALAPTAEVEARRTLGLDRDSRSKPTALDAPIRKDRLLARVGAVPSIPGDGVWADSGVNDPLVGAAELQALLAEHDYPVIDTRSRADYRAAHILGSVNIPTDELQARAIHELPLGTAVFIYCHYCSPCEAEASAQAISTQCTIGTRLLRLIGFRRLRIIDDDLDSLRRSGVPVVDHSF